MISIFPSRMIRENGLSQEVNAHKKMSLIAANGSPMDCSGAIELYATVRATKRKRKIHFKVSNSVNEIFI